MDKQKTDQLAEKVWMSLVIEGCKSAGISIDLPRELLAVRLILKHKLDYDKAILEHDLESAISSLLGAKRVWQFACLDIAGWLVEIWPPMGSMQERLQVREDWKGDEQRALRISLMHQIGRDMIGVLDGAYDRIVDPIAVIFPRWLAESLMDALQALPYGEVRQIVKPIVIPKEKRRHNETWTLDKMRLRALEHVVFIIARGGGSDKGLAQERVARAMKISARTLQDWDKKMSDGTINHQYIESARLAGELQREIDEDPSLLDTDLASYHDYKTLISFHEEPLKAFGERYQRHEYHRRHNQP